MGLLDKLDLGGTLFNNGVNSQSTPTIPTGATPLSTLHDEYSLNGTPGQESNVPTPSLLDLNGGVPSYNYRNNAPIEGLGRI